jgi:hypothetical protein
MHHDAQRRKSKARQRIDWRSDGIESHCIVGNAVKSEETALHSWKCCEKRRNGIAQLEML